MSNNNGEELLALRGRNAAAAGRATDEAPARQVLVLRLRNEEEERLREEQANRRITWRPDVHDPVNQRTSKKCCVFHRKRMFGESSSEDSSSCSDEEEAPAEGATGGCCGAASASGTTTDQEGGCCPTAKQKRRRPKCSKKHCFCGTRFS